MEHEKITPAAAELANPAYWEHRYPVALSGVNEFLTLKELLDITAKPVTGVSITCVEHDVEELTRSLKQRLGQTDK